MPTLEHRAAETVGAIEAAFEGVSRQGGVSLHQTKVLDALSSKTELVEAGAKDTDTKWQEVPDSTIKDNLLSICFLDPIGFRYYIPAYMIWEIKQMSGQGWVDCNAHGDALFFLTPNEWNPRARMEYFQALSEEQSHAVYLFLQFLNDYGDESDKKEAQQAIERYWGNFS